MDIEPLKTKEWNTRLKWKHDIASFFCAHKIIEHKNTEEAYAHLENNAVVLEIVNPYRKENLFIEIAGEITVSFSGWHAHYALYDPFYSEMKNDALSIIDGTYGVLCLFRADMCLCSILWKKELSYLTKPADLLSQLHVPVGTIKDANMVIAAEYWRPDDCYEFEPAGKSEQPSDYSFPRRYSVRFILKDEKCYGSGSQKKYDDTTAYIKAVYVDDVDKASELHAALIKYLEADARKAGASKIFGNISQSEFDLYAALGYTEVPKIDDDKIRKLNGAIVIFDKTMMKNL